VTRGDGTVKPVTGKAGDRAAVIAPGQAYSADGPLLMYAALAVERCGGLARRITWAVPEFASAGEERAWVISQVSMAVDALQTTTGTPVVIGKSLGSLAAPLAASRGLPAVWLTPVLTDESTLTALQQGTAPCLLVGGTADPLWDGRLARSVTPHVLEVEGADHGMFVPGRLAASAAVLGRVAAAVEDFLDHHVWPRSSHEGPRETSP
jgi:hypothetical protein